MSKIKIEQRPIELKNKTCGIIGLGGIGLPLAERLKTFGMKIMGFLRSLCQWFLLLMNFTEDRT